MGPTRVFRVASSRGMSNIWTEGVPGGVNRTEFPGEQKRSALRQRRCASFCPVLGCSPLEGRVLQTASHESHKQGLQQEPLQGLRELPSPTADCSPTATVPLWQNKRLARGFSVFILLNLSLQSHLPQKAPSETPSLVNNLCPLNGKMGVGRRGGAPDSESVDVINC